MKHSRSASLAAVSVALWIAVAGAARPRYGGLLRVETAAVMRTLNPSVAPLDGADATARRVLFPLIFETLVVPEIGGGLRGLLAVAWEHNADATEWRFRLRSGVRLHDGTPLDGARIAAALQAREPGWRISADGSSVAIGLDQASPGLAWQLADVRYAIAFGRPGGGEPIGSGPFAIERWEPRRLRLRSHEEHWQGRPFVDAVQVEMGRPIGEQATALDLGRADFVAMRADDVRRVSSRGLRIVSSEPRELVALVFPPDGPAAAVRQALTRAVDRGAMASALLQRHGAPAVGLLPGWISGYEALLAAPLDRARSRSLVAGLPAAQRQLTLAPGNSDPMLRSIAERVVVDARDVGLTITISSGARARSADVQLLRVAVDPTTPERAFAALVEKLGVRIALDVQSLDALYRTEQRLLDDGNVVPLVHVPDLYAVGPRVESWNAPMVQPWGAWNLANMWLKADGR